MNKKSKIILTAGIVIIAGAAAAGFYLNRQNDTEKNNGISLVQEEQNLDETNENQSNNLNPNVAGQVPNKDSIAVSGQIAGENIIIDQAYLSKPGYVVIYDTINGQTGKLLGQSKILKAGLAQDLVINLKAEKNKLYTAALFYDDGDNVFNATKDIQVTSDSKPVVKTFSAK